MQSDATILFVAANPTESGRLALDEEARDIQERIQLRSCRVALSFRARWAARPRDLLTALNEDRPAVVHFSGHGAGSAGLVFHDEHGLSKAVSGEALHRLFTAVKGGVRIVVLNACYSEEQARRICDVIDCVVGMSQPIADRSARVFAIAFMRRWDMAVMRRMPSIKRWRPSISRGSEKRTRRASSSGTA